MMNFVRKKIAIIENHELGIYSIRHDLVKAIAEKYLPAELINQPKRGFEIPLKKWIDGELKELIATYVFSADAYSNNFVSRKFIKDLWDKRVKTGDEKRAKMIWTLFALEVWHKKVYSGNLS